MYNQQTLADTFPTSPFSADISSRIIDELRELYFGQFDNHWFITLLDSNAFNTSRLRYIQNMLVIQSIYSTEAAVFNDGIETLEEVILTARRYILPVLRDKLRISGFYKSRGNDSKEELVMRDLFSYTFPYNLKRLEELTIDLKENLL
ncbi:MAG: hypothetical protein JEZ04_13405 [Spirochaetales bacterium]|nr:hypothetical protein [Spirochaetales bacterium]